MKKILAFLLILTLIITMAGCGSSPVSTDATTGAAAGTSSASGTDSADSTGADKESTTVPATDPEDNKVDIDSDFQITTEVENGVTISGTVYTISKAGEYTLEGKLEDGQIVIDTADEEKVVLNLNGVSLNCSTNSPVYCVSADQLSVKAVDGTYNEINDNRELLETEDDSQGNAAVYSKCDTVITGTGNLVVNAGYNNGIQTTKDLTVKKIILKVTAPNNALKGNNSVTIESGELTVISTGGDGIETDDSDVTSKGNQKGTIEISGGIVDVYAACDGIAAAYDVVISDTAVVNVCTDDYSDYTGSAVGTKKTTDFYVIVESSQDTSSYKYAVYYYNEGSEENGVFAAATYCCNVYSSSRGGRGGMSTTYHAMEVAAPSGYSNMVIYRFASSSSYSTTEYAAKTTAISINSSMNAYLLSTISGSSMSGDFVNLTMSNGNGSAVSTKGIKAGNQITISGGNVVIYAVDDAIHASVKTLDSGATGLGSVVISGGTIVITSGDDGVHADKELEIDGGNITIETSYEGLEGNVITINGGNTVLYAKDDGVNAAGSYMSPYIYINGGTLQVTTPTGDTDGIDANGSYVQTGGVVLVRGGSSSGNMAGSIDVDGTVKVTGGTAIAIGGICETPTSGSCNYITMQRKSFSAGNYQILDGNGNVIASFTLDGTYTSAWICSESFVKGSSYSITKDGSTLYKWTQNSSSQSVS